MQQKKSAASQRLSHSVLPLDKIKSLRAHHSQNIISGMRRLFNASLQRLKQTASQVSSLLPSSAETENNLRYFCSPCFYNIATSIFASWKELKGFLPCICAPCCLELLTTDQPVIAGVLMHGPGLYVKWSLEQWPDYLQSITSAAGQLCFRLLIFSTHSVIEALG